MKTFMISLFAVLAFAVGEAQTVQKEVIEKGTLIVTETVEVMRVPGVPRGLSAETARKLVTGELKTATAHPLLPSFDFFFSSPGATITEEYADEAVTYQSGTWMTRAAPSRIEKSDSVVVVFFLWFPVLSIAALSVWAGLYLEADRNASLICCYAALFSGIASASVFQSLGVGAIVGAMVGMATGAAVVENLLGVLLGMASGASLGLFADLLVRSQNPQGVIRYTLFIIMVAAASFTLALVVKWVKERTGMAMRSASSH